MRAHEAGALHAEGYGAAPQWLPYPDEVMALLPQLWSDGVTRDGDGALAVAGVSATELARDFGTPAYVMDEDDFRRRARAFRDEFTAPFERTLAGADVYYAGKAFLCSAVAAWVMQEGLCLDVCSLGELSVAMRVGFPGNKIGMHGNNKSAEEIRAGLTYGVGPVSYTHLDVYKRQRESSTRLRYKQFRRVNHNPAHPGRSRVPPAAGLLQGPT